MRESIIDQLEEVTADSVSRRSLDNLMELSMFGRLLAVEYQTQEEPLPQSVSSALRLIKMQISIKQHERLAKRLMDAKARRERLLPAEERRTAVDKEIADLEAQLATK